MNKFRPPSGMWWALGCVAFCASGRWLTPLLMQEANSEVDWALRLPRERERARIAGFTGTRRPAPNFDPAQDAGVDWVRLEAILKGNEPDGKLPDPNDALVYVNRRTRGSVRRGEMLALLRKYRRFFPQAEAAGRKPHCYLPVVHDKAWRDGGDAAELMAALLLVSAVEERGRGRMELALTQAASALSISRQFQAQDARYCFQTGTRLEIWVVRFVLDGFTTTDGRARQAWARAVAPQQDLFLRPFKEEPSPGAQFRALLANDHLLTREILRKFRAEKYRPEKYPFMESSAVLRLLNRLDFVLSRRTAADAWEASSAWAVAGLAVRLRSQERETRSYSLWKAVRGWDRHAENVMRGESKFLRAEPWARLPLRRVYRDADRALARAVCAEAGGSPMAVLPDDPFAPRPGIPLRRRRLADGVTVWYSIGVNEKDDGGDPRKDRVVKLPPIKKDDL